MSPPNANVIAGLLDKYANGATTVIQQDALQAALWTAIYGYNTTGFALVVTNSDVLTQMEAYLGYTGSGPITVANAPTASVSSIYWLSPGDGSSNIYQALVTANNGSSHDAISSAEPSTLVIAGVSALGFLGYGWKRRKRS